MYDLLGYRQGDASRSIPFFIPNKTMKLQEVIAVLDTIAPFAAAEQWDNVGLMVGDTSQEVCSILVALDPLQEVIDTAFKNQTDLIITHHPLIFSPIKQINFMDATSRKIADLIRSSISLVSMHTNLDIAEGGVADVLAGKLSLRDIQSSGFVRVGTIEREAPLLSWVEGLPFEKIRIVDANRPVKKVCVCPGSGMDHMKEAFEMGCDTFVTGDVKYHAALDAWEAGINIVDLGHFGSEQIVVAPLAERLRKELPTLAIDVYGAQDVFTNIKGERS